MSTWSLHLIRCASIVGALLLGVLCPSARAQLTLEWSRDHRGPLEDRVEGLAVDSDGNVLVTMSTRVYSGGSFNHDWLTIKYGPSGDELWRAQFGEAGSGREDDPSGIVVDPAGNAYVTGDSGRDYATVKYDPDGSMVWQATWDSIVFDDLGNVRHTADTPAAIALGPDGDVYVTGTAWAQGVKRYVTVKYDRETGGQLWEASYSNVWYVGNPPIPQGYSEPVAIAVDAQGSVVVTGYSERWSGVSRHRDTTTVKYASDGPELWVSRYPGVGAASSQATDLTLDADGNALVVGWGPCGEPCNQAQTLKYDGDGNLLWAATESVPGLYKRATDVAADGDGNVYVTGLSGVAVMTANLNWETVKYSSAGEKLWTRTSLEFPPSGSRHGSPGDIVLDSRGDVYVGGCGHGGCASCFCGGLVAKYDPDGVLQWTDPTTGGGVAFLTVPTRRDLYTSGTTVLSPHVVTARYAQALVSEPPVADAGGPYFVECSGPFVSIGLDGTGSTDPDADPVTHLWETDCPNGVFDDPTSATPTLVIDGPPPCPVDCEVVLTVTDPDEESDSEATSVTVADTLAPQLAGVPEDQAVACSSVPGPPTVTASDDCDPAATVELTETRTDGDCPDRYTLTRTWASTDDCGNVTSVTRTVTVQDAAAPVLSGVPADETVTCSADVPAPPEVTASDDCGPAPAVQLDEVRTDGACPNRFLLTRTWSSQDRCGNSVAETRTVVVADTVAPAVVEGGDDLHCLWPPNHLYQCFVRSDFSPVITENCGGPVDWWFAGCASDQPDAGVTDDDLPDDCVVTDDGERFCVRAERADDVSAGRRYSVTILAEDECGNRSQETRVGYVHVPHHLVQRQPEGCLRAQQQAP